MPLSTACLAKLLVAYTAAAATQVA